MTQRPAERERRRVRSSGSSRARSASTRSATRTRATRTRATRTRSAGRQQPRKQPVQLPLIPLALAILVIVALIFAVKSCAKQEEPTTTASSVASQTSAVQSAYFPTIQDSPSLIAQAADAIPGSADVQTFSLSDADAPALSSQQQETMETALENYGSTCGFAVVNLDTGQGVCANAGQALFGASSFKAAYATYVCSQLVENGTLSLDSNVPDPAADYDPVAPDQWDDPLCVGGLIQNAVILSDNAAYESLRVYDYFGYSEWMEALGVESLLSSERSWYPDYSAAQGFILWANIYSYLLSGTETAQWLGDQLQETELSFLRQGLSSDIQVRYDKAGWDDDVENGYTAMNDCGIVQANGHTYLVAILTTMPGVEENFPLMNQLVAQTIGTALEALA